MARGGRLADLRDSAEAVLEFPSSTYDDVHVVFHDDRIDNAESGRIGAELLAVLTSDLQAVDAGEPLVNATDDIRQPEAAVDVELSGLNLAPEIAESVARRLAIRVDELIGHRSNASAASGCVCASQLPGRRIDIATTFEKIEREDPTLPYVIALFPSRSQYEALRWRVEDGAPYGVDASSVLVGLASQVSWAKEIVGWNMCRANAMWRLHVPGAVPEENAIYTLARAGDRCRQSTHTLVFRKPGFLGWWIDVCHFPPNQFWDWCGGKRWTFTWVGDR